jgi:hypothetical protein
MSRQSEWQKRKAVKGRCIICARKAVSKSYCETHRIAHNIVVAEGRIRKAKIILTRRRKREKVARLKRKIKTTRRK